MPSLSTPHSADVRRLRPDLENLARALAALHEPDRSTVIAAASEQEQRESARRTLSSDDWDAVHWFLGLAGNDVEDCDWAPSG